jgi:hypothetical protein
VLAAPRYLGVCGNEAREPIPARDCVSGARGQPNRGVALSRWGSAQICVVMHAEVAREFAQALSFRREVTARQTGLAQFSNRKHQRSALPPSRSKSIDSSAEITVLSARNNRPLYSARRIAMRVLLWASIA